MTQGGKRGAGSVTPHRTGMPRTCGAGRPTGEHRPGQRGLTKLRARDSAGRSSPRVVAGL